MKESYEEDVANQFALQRRGDFGNNVVLSVRAEGLTGRLCCSEIPLFPTAPVLTGVRSRRERRCGLASRV